MMFAADAGDYFPAPIFQLFPSAFGNFEIYIRQGDRHALFAKSGKRFSTRQREILRENGVGEVYIRREERAFFQDYLRRYMPGALADEELALAERAAIFQRNSCEIVSDLIREKLPQGVSNRHYDMFLSFVRQSLDLVSCPSGLARMASIMSHDYDVYSHSLHVFVYACFLLRSLGMAEQNIVQAGAGALLHDAGKERIALAILQKPGPLNAVEWEEVRTHPAMGLHLCRNLPLSRITAETIFMHHEKVNGKGYPHGLKGEEIPLHARAVALADVYDALTSNRVYAPAVKPFEALRIMRDEMVGSFDMDLYKRFVLLLSGSDLL